MIQATIDETPWILVHVYAYILGLIKSKLGNSQTLTLMMSVMLYFDCVEYQHFREELIPQCSCRLPYIFICIFNILTKNGKAINIPRLTSKNKSKDFVTWCVNKRLKVQHVLCWLKFEYNSYQAMVCDACCNSIKYRDCITTNSDNPTWKT